MAASAEEIERVYRERYAPFRRAAAALLGDEQRGDLSYEAIGELCGISEGTEPEPPVALALDFPP
jgi:hypothetical protein